MRLKAYTVENDTIGGVSFWGKEWPFCRKCVTVGVDFEVLVAEARPGVAFICATY